MSTDSSSLECVIFLKFRSDWVTQARLSYSCFSLRSSQVYVGTMNCERTLDKIKKHLSGKSENTTIFSSLPLFVLYFFIFGYKTTVSPCIQVSWNLLCSPGWP